MCCLCLDVFRRALNPGSERYCRTIFLNDRHVVRSWPLNDDWVRFQDSNEFASFNCSWYIWLSVSACLNLVWVLFGIHSLTLRCCVVAWGRNAPASLWALIDKTKNSWKSLNAVSNLLATVLSVSLPQPPGIRCLPACAISPPSLTSKPSSKLSFFQQAFPQI